LVDRRSEPSWSSAPRPYIERSVVWDQIGGRLSPARPVRRAGATGLDRGGAHEAKGFHAGRDRVGVHAKHPRGALVAGDLPAGHFQGAPQVVPLEGFELLDRPNPRLRLKSLRGKDRLPCTPRQRSIEAETAVGRRDDNRSMTF